MSTKSARLSAVLGIVVLASSVQASPQDAPPPQVVEAVVSDADQAAALATVLRAAIDSTVSNDYPSEVAAQQAAVTTVLQAAIIESGASPLVALSAVSAALYCPSGAVPATEAGDTRIAVACSPGLSSPIDTPTRTALEALLAQISALLAAEQPAALAGGFFGGLGFPPAAGLTAGGSDYIA